MTFGWNILLTINYLWKLMQCVPTGSFWLSCSATCNLELDRNGMKNQESKRNDAIALSSFPNAVLSELQVANRLATNIWTGPKGLKHVWKVSDYNCFQKNVWLTLCNDFLLRMPGMDFYRTCKTALDSMMSNRDPSVSRSNFRYF